MKEGPLLGKEVISYLDIKKDGFYIDATAGMGYLSEVILNELGADGALLMTDLDEDLCGILNENKLFREKRVMIENSSYTELPDVIKKRKLPKADGILFDFGVGTYQLNSDRGFSFMKDDFPDMRYSRRTGLRAWDVINSYPEKELADIIYKFGEERRSRRIAKRIAEARSNGSIDTVSRLAEIIKKCAPGGKIHPATKTFQALRIFVNGELENVEAAFSFLPEIMKPGARCVFLTFHSLEDRIVKNSLKKLASDGIINLLTKKAVKASYAQSRIQPRARSIRLRAAQII
ncbi:16S rRNA (cytosine(1402)-N(4))-methyltransferase RsmH [bacterium]|nr:16S rRNA (cytosine(1402)-N(4))-methyltransferase RsmH [bacterium]MBU4134385.1 16S rRNA (cytosine(1402)-N(4))-methyltransferase RsmH [bacterium]